MYLNVFGIVTCFVGRVMLSLSNNDFFVCWYVAFEKRVVLIVANALYKSPLLLLLLLLLL